MKRILDMLRKVSARSIARAMEIAEPLLRKIPRPIPKKYYAIAGGAFAFFLLVMFVPGGVMDRTSTTAFCGSCHVMESQYEHWFLTGVHVKIRCVDCHLPHDNPVSYFVWKGIDGMKDVVFFYGRLYPENIRISSHGASTVQGNCVRCHEGTVMMINTEGRNCWSCHRRLSHTIIDVGYIK